MGAFWQPVRVIADVNTLSTLPPETFADGMAEVIKTACIKDEQLFRELETGIAMKETHIEATIARCMDIKRGVVERDETESASASCSTLGIRWGTRWKNTTITPI